MLSIGRSLLTKVSLVRFPLGSLLPVLTILKRLGFCSYLDLRFVVADESGGGESGASGSGSGSGTEPAPAPPATGTPIPIGDAVVSTICVLYIFLSFSSHRLN